LACSSGRQPNFAALNRGRHLYSAGQPSSWALAYISSCMSISLPETTAALYQMEDPDPPMEISPPYSESLRS